jgi:CO/xanthine dehydrogenase Mo-binding subunit
MSTHELEFTEPERYELHEGPFYHFQITRRHFVQVLGAGLLISVAVPGALGQRSPSSRAPALAERLHIAPDGTVTVLSSKVEVGQGSRTQLTQAAAEELRLPVAQIEMILADSSVVPDDGGTAGSRTTPSTVPAVRKACAAARQLLIDTAAAQFGTDAKKLSVSGGKVEGLGAEQEFSYADLASDKHSRALEREVAPGVTVMDVERWQVLGTSVPHVDGKSIVT